MSNKLKRLRFSLRSLILLVALAGSGYGLWSHWEPWEIEQRKSVDKKPVIPQAELPNRNVFVSKNGTVVATMLVVLIKEEDLFADTRALYRTDIQIWDSVTLNSTLQISFGSLSNSPDFHLSPDGQFLSVSFTAEISEVEAGEDGERSKSMVSVWNTKTGQMTQSYQVGFYPMGSFSTAIHPDNERLIVYDEDIRIFNMKYPAKSFTLSPSKGTDLREPFTYPDLDISPDGSLLAVTYYDHRVKSQGVELWDLRKKTQLRKLECNRYLDVESLESITDIWFRSDGKNVIIYGWKSQAIMWNTEDNSVSNLPGEAANASFYSPSEQFIVMEDKHGSYVCEAASGRRLFNLQSLLLDMLPLAYVDDGMKIICMDDKLEMLILLSRRRPEYWYGVAWLPQFWVTTILSASLLWSLRKDTLNLKTAAEPNLDQPQSSDGPKAVGQC